MTVRKLAGCLRALVRTGVALGIAFSFSDALAVQRTFVASYGGDLNPCSLALPCRSFGRAITQTNVDGEIIVLDSAGYGAVTVDKGVSIIAPAGVYAGISVFSGDGVTVDAPGARVVLRGLTINGQGGHHGISFVDGAELLVERCVVAFMQGHGLAATAAGGRVSVRQSTLRSNGASGISLGDVETTLDEVLLERNLQPGLVVRGTARASATHIVVDGNTNGGIVVVGPGDPRLTIESSMIGNNIGVGNFGNGIRLIGGGASVEMALARSTVAHNENHGIELNPGSLGLHVNLKENQIVSNGSSGLRSNQINMGVARMTALSNRVAFNDIGFDNSGAVPANSTLQTIGDNMVRGNLSANLFGPITLVPGD